MNCSKKRRKITVQKFYLDLWVEHRETWLEDEFPTWQLIKSFYGKEECE